MYHIGLAPFYLNTEQGQHKLPVHLAIGQTFCDLHTLLHTFLDFLVNITK